MGQERFADVVERFTNGFAVRPARGLARRRSSSGRRSSTATSGA